MAGALYWLHVGPLLIADVIAPALVLLHDLYYLRMDPLAYLLVYVPTFSLGITYYMKAMRRYNSGCLSSSYTTPHTFWYQLL